MTEYALISRENEQAPLPDLLLSVKTVKMSDLEPADAVATNDYLLAANDSSVSSYALNLSSLGECAVDGIERADPFVPAGQWNFVSGGSRVFIPKSTRQLSAANGNEVPNLRYAYDILVSALDALSAQLYSQDVNKLYLPSYKGMVLLGDNLTNEAMLKKIYGSHTVWTRIAGRFILGAGSCEANTNNTYGTCSSGEVNVSKKRCGGTNKAELKGIPKHFHAFGSQYDKIPEREIGFDLETEMEGINNELGKPSGKHYKHTDNWHKHGKHRYGNYPELISNPELEPIEKEYSFKAQGEILDDEERWKGTPHNNIPPYYVTHIWERTQ